MPVKKEGKFGYARYLGVDGYICAEYNVNGAGARVKWWQPFEANGEPLMFSLRSDGQWRAFPGAANGAVLETQVTARSRRVLSPV